MHYAELANPRTPVRGFAEKSGAVKPCAIRKNLIRSAFRKQKSFQIAGFYLKSQFLYRKNALPYKVYRVYVFLDRFWP